MAFINIVTPCVRPENLGAIAGSINIPESSYRWIVVFDADEIPSIDLPSNAEVYAHRNTESRSGNAQRNFANKMIRGGYVLYLDDDTILHPKLWESVKECTEDLVGWKQCNKDDSHRLSVGEWQVGFIDSGSFMVDQNTMGDSDWALDRYDADGYFAREMRLKAKTVKEIYDYLSIYNYLR
jgi:glycosyltransferase involved in cell wall biosynthesis